MQTELKPRAWLCELAEEDGTTRTQFVEEDPDGLRWNDAGEPSPYRTTPLLTLAQAAQMVAAERERLAELMERQHTWISSVSASRLIRGQKYVSPVTECEACLTEDACRIRGQCAHYLREVDRA